MAKYKCLILQVFIIMLSLLAAGGAAMAGECEVSSSNADSFSSLLKSAANGGCKTEDVKYREKYQALYGGIVSFNVIRFTRSVEIQFKGASEPLSGEKLSPLVIVADAGVEVILNGAGMSPSAEGLVIDDNVIIDGIVLKVFPGEALTLKGDNSLIINSEIVKNGERAASPASGVLVLGNNNKIVNSRIASNALNGVEISETMSSGGCGSGAVAMSVRSGSGNMLMGNDIHNNGTKSGGDQDGHSGAGVYVNGWGTSIQPLVLKDGQEIGKTFGKREISDEGETLIRNTIHDNEGDGVYVSSESAQLACMEESLPADWYLYLHTSLITGSLFYDNGGAGINISKYALQPPVDLAFVSSNTSDEYTIVGNIGKATATNGSPWGSSLLNVKRLRVEIFAADSVASGEGMKLVASTEGIDALNGAFVVHVVKKGLEDAAFVATVVDLENENTSVFSEPMGSVNKDDMDNDGIPNEQEDMNHDGVVDLGETDPRLADTDGDGLTDGEERLLNGRVGELIASGLKLQSPKGLDPTNFDSDGDCLPDGLELGVDKARMEELLARTDGSMLGRPVINISAACRALLKQSGTLTLENAIPVDPSEQTGFDNIGAMFDLDPASMTDPTSGDSDGDGLRDGLEDDNLNGKIDVDADGAVKETDPMNPDSDGDGLRDGEEGDKNGNGQLDSNEMDPLSNDTDDDGVTDDLELRLGSLPNSCDSDGDGLSDGIEAVVVHPMAERSECVGLQAVGTNYSNSGLLNTVVPDSDGDGVSDGNEDINHNGWVDPGESDPSNPDSDGDGILDGLEDAGDIDGDKVPDFDVAHINNGSDCNPPISMKDVDCDQIPNSVDNDSDNDGCLDSDEGVLSDGDMDAVPDAYDADTKKCGGSGSGGSGGGSVSLGESQPPSDEGDGEGYEQRIVSVKGGGACSLVGGDARYDVFQILSVVAALIMMCFRRRSKTERCA